MPIDQATQIITDGRGTHFDPDVVDAFVAIQHQFQAIAARFRDTDQDLAHKAAALAAAAPGVAP